MNLRFGSRESRLAIVQSELLLEPLRRAYPEAQIELITMKTTGDRILDRTLDQVGGKGLFTRELDQTLLDGLVDFTIHSLKDVPMELPEALPLVAFSRREDPRDCLVLPKGVLALAPDQPIGCSSQRRRLQLQQLYPGHEVIPIRGNVLTRLDKLDSGGYAALVLAAAGLKRLGLEHRIHRYFSIEEMLPAAGQGILAVQSRRGVDCSPLQVIHDPEAASCALAERSFIRALNGGCSSPMAAYAAIKHGILTLTGLYVSPDGTTVQKADILGSPDQAEALGHALAHHLKEWTNP